MRILCGSLLERLRRAFALCVTLFTLAFVSADVLSQVRVIGYYPMWARTTLPPREVKFNYLTHIMHAFAWPDTNGVISAYDAVSDTALINATHRAGRKILISLGGAAESSAFPRLVADTTSRHAFVRNVVSYLKTNGYDGVDLDWEGPQNPADKANEVLMITELRNAFNIEDASWLLTMAVGVSSWSGQWHDFASLGQHVDWFNAMCYDFHGDWSSHSGHNAPLYAPSFDVNDGSVDQGIQYLHTTRGIPTAKLVMGMPFYGKQFLAPALYTGFSKPVTDISYADVLYNLAHNWTYVWDTVSQVPYLTSPSKTKVVTFDDSTSLTIKCSYAKSKQLSGVMIWALGQDVVPQGQPLMEAVGRAMYGSSDVVARPGDVSLSGFVLYTNYPNPFNPTTTIEFSLPRAMHVTLKVFDLLGREVATLVKGVRGAGLGSAQLDASALHLTSGMYFYRLEAGAFIQTKKFLVAK
jgi:chitinase